MIKMKKAWQAALWFGALGIMASASAATIFKSVGPNGIEHYATQPLDPSYKPYLKGHRDNNEGNLNTQKNETTTLPDVTLASLIHHSASKHDIDALLIHAIISVESKFNPHATSPKGASGLMQLMPATAAQYGAINIYDPEENIEAGTRYLKDLLKRHNGNVALALASYNAGQGKTTKHGNRIPPYKETMLFVPAVLAKLQALRTAQP